MDKRYHLALFSPGYIELILIGQKTIESRFSKIRCAPYGKIRQGDVIYMKEIGGPIKGVMRAGKIETFTNLTNDDIILIDATNRRNIFCDWSFKSHLVRWHDCKYATLIHVDDYIKCIEPSYYKNSSRMPWVVLDEKLSLNKKHDRYYDL